jgi:hypothetical protein
VEAYIFVALGEQGLVAYDALQGIDWTWLAMDGAITKAPLGGEIGLRLYHISPSWPIVIDSK